MAPTLLIKLQRKTSKEPKNEIHPIRPTTHHNLTLRRNQMMPMEPTPEQRVNTATVHENTAACLKSDKTVEACHSEMRSSCKSMMGNDACRMMKHDKMMKNRK